MKKKIIFFSFATRDLSISINRLKQEAINSKFYDQIKILSNNDIDAKGKKILLKFKNKRGYGYWFWKPYLILKIMKKMNAGDILHYADIGCHINSKAYKKFKEYSTPEIQKTDITSDILDLFKLPYIKNIGDLKKYLNTLMDPPKNDFIISY